MSVSLVVRGKPRDVPVAEGATAAVLFAAVAEDFSDCKLLYKGRKLEPGDGVAPGMRVMVTRRGGNQSFGPSFLGARLSMPIGELRSQSWILPSSRSPDESGSRTDES